MSRTIKAVLGVGGMVPFVVFTSIPEVAAQGTCVPAPSGMVAWWPGDGSTADIAGARNGSLVGSAGFTAGRVGDAFSFDSSSSVEVADDPIWTLGDADFTIDLWVRFHDLSGRDPFIAHDDGGNLNHKWIFWYDTTGHDKQLGVPALRFHTNTPAGGPDLHPHDPVVAPWNPLLQRWYFVAVTRSGTSYALYIDGAQVATDSSPYTILDPSVPLTIGRAEAFRLNGLVDEVEIFDRALSAEEIQAIFTAGSAGKCKELTANAGADQARAEGQLVTLDGTFSFGPPGAPLTYSWTQVAGTTVAPSFANPARPTFTAPDVAAGGETLTFQLTVSDGSETSPADSVNVVVKDLDHAPVSDAGDDQSVAEGALVTLDGTHSYDPDSDALAYAWHQTAGTAVTLSAPASAQPTFTAPAVGQEGETLSFELTVADGLASTIDSVSVQVDNVNHAPAAAAGADQTAGQGTDVTLDGSGSNDPDADPLSYEWNQLSGEPVELSDASASSPTFTTPAVAAGGEQLVFSLIVYDGLAASPPDEVSVHVQVPNDPPVCTLARPSLGSLWPPNHKLVAIALSGVADPDQDEVIVTILGVTQDEPVNGLGDGDTSPDAVIQDHGVLLRAERSGNGNGRVYRVAFQADDGFGGICTGSVDISVPHSRNGTAINNGQSHNSLAE